MDVDDVIQCAADLVDKGGTVDEDYQRGVVDLAALLCFGSDPTGIAARITAYAVYGVNRPAPPPVGSEAR